MQCCASQLSFPAATLVTAHCVHHFCFNPASLLRPLPLVCTRHIPVPQLPPFPPHTHPQVAGSKGANIAYLLDTKGPEIRTAMLRGGANVELSKDQEVILVAVGAAYKTWEGGVNPDTGGRACCPI